MFTVWVCLLAPFLFLVRNSIQAAPNDPNDAPIVTLPGGGQLRGSLLDDLGDGFAPVHAFQGIRYGRAARFQLPQMANESWSGVRNATRFDQFAQCPEVEIPSGNGSQGYNHASGNVSEDCLFLSVWRPAKAAAQEPAAHRAVMVWIHGLSLRPGINYDGRYLASVGDVVVVSINYRLGLFGLLYGGGPDSGAPGNQALHDQLLALRWVQRNIASFGGDPARVTVFGQESGAVFAGLLLLSPLAKEGNNSGRSLFRRVILQSGSPFQIPQLRNNSQSVVQQSQTTALEAARDIAARVNCSEGTTNRAMIACLQAKSTHELVTLIRPMVDDAKLDVVLGDTLLPHPALDHTLVGVDLMFGVAEDEHLDLAELHLATPIPHSPDETLLEREKWLLGRILANAMSDRFLPDNTNVSEIIDFYLGSETITDPDDRSAIRQAISDLLSDLDPVCPTVLFGQELARYNYYNQLNHQPGVNNSSNGHHPNPNPNTTTTTTYYSYRFMLSPSTSAKVPLFVFGLPLGLPPDVLYSKQEAQLSLDMIRAWASFAKTGHPGRLGSGSGSGSGSAGVLWEAAFEPNSARVPETRYMTLQSGGHYRMVSGAYKRNCDSLWKRILLN